MTDKTNTYSNTVAIAKPARPRVFESLGALMNGGTGRTILIVTAVAACTFLVLGGVPLEWSWEGVCVLSVGVVLIAGFYFPTDHPKPAFVMWALILISECIFFREGDIYAGVDAYMGKFPTAVYGEVVSWCLFLVAALICAARFRGYAGRLIAGDYKWMTLFALVCLGSSLYSPRPAFGLVWAFKLALTVLILVLCSIRISDLRDTVSFLRFSTFAFLFVVLEPVIIAAMRGEMFDEEGRMSTIVSPNALSPNAGALLLLVLILYSRRKGEGMNKSAILIGMVACIIMILAGSKTGIVAAIFAGGLYFVVRRKVGSAFGYIGATALLIALLASSTPLGNYFHLYEERQGIESFSGRTILWNAVIPAIEQKPIFGHGYLASEFVSIQVNAVTWEAPHLHNGFMEALYNSGVIGLLAVLALLIVIPRNLYRVLRRASPDDRVYQIGAGCLALYFFLLINGLFNSSFGGKPSVPFMLMLALVVVSQKLQEQIPYPVTEQA
ncbi:MAG: O-antigen ligase family protein [Candidatus Sulfotelmatobacter sp.]